jgi:superfamily II DNA helicase RecQ
MNTPTLPYSVAGQSDIRFIAASRTTMQQAFGFSPFAWQEDILTHLFKMSSSTYPLASAPTFLCQPTGGGKSLVRDAFTAGRGGISWCIGPLLALGADQESKINKRSLSNDGRTLAIHLDAYRTHSQQVGIWNELAKYTRKSELSVVILSSPQFICSSKLIQEMFTSLLDSGTMQLVRLAENPK